MITKQEYIRSAINRSKDFEVWANGEEIFVYQDQQRCYPIQTFGGELYKMVKDQPSFAILSSNKKIDFKIKCRQKFNKIKIRPLSKGVEYNIKENIIQFSIDKPMKLSIEFDDDLSNPLFILVNPVEKDKPGINDPLVHYYGKGQIYDIGTLQLKSGETVYIEEGAVVFGTIYSENTSNISIKGRGILCGSRLHRIGGEIVQRFAIRVINGENINIEGITLFDGSSWQVVPIASRNITIKDLNIISFVPSADGIDIVTCENVKITNCFIKTNDDCIVVKGIKKWESGGHRSAKNIVAENCVLWSATHGNALEIGYETQCDEISDITFRNTDIIHCEFEGYQSGGALTIHNGDRAVIKNVLYDNIRIEDAQQKLVDIKVLSSVYSKDNIRGEIHHVNFKNIQVINKILPPSIIRGFETDTSVFKVQTDTEKGIYVIRDISSRGCIEGIHFEGIYHNGNKLSNFLEAGIVLEMITNISIT